MSRNEDLTVANHGLPPNRIGERAGDLQEGTGDVGAGAAKQTGLGRPSERDGRHLLQANSTESRHVA